MLCNYNQYMETIFWLQIRDLEEYLSVSTVDHIFATVMRSFTCAFGVI